ncbi:hypothetical protein AcV5_008418 [Taiwanofungus camphoratus]|nr:hypothetical protein AcV5_008418 [Antrodia cinnamomea]KAI0955860.1 hypothetical protein AcV7_006409 [Antrodia cinnamomea]
MFRAAFPTASEESERAEAAWVRSSYDTIGANKTGRARFAGTWVSPEVALALADAYSLSSVIHSLAEAAPDPNIVYRRSSRAQQPTPNASPVSNTLPSPPPKELGPNPPKRRREASPAPASITSTTAVSTSLVAEATVLSTPPASASRTATSPTPRRSARLKSPAAAPVPVTPVSPKAHKNTRANKKVLTPAGSDETVVDNDSVEVTKAAEVNMHEDIQEQQDLIARLKAERGAERRQKEEVQGAAAGSEAKETAQKRAREDDDTPYKFNFTRPEEQVEERVIATNRRVKPLSQLPPQRKSLAWGALAFAAGWGAMSLLPNLQNYLS